MRPTVPAVEAATVNVTKAQAKVIALSRQRAQAWQVLDEISKNLSSAEAIFAMNRGAMVAALNDSRWSNS